MLTDSFASVLVTGATGFVGRVVVAELQRRGHRVATVGRRSIASFANVRHAMLSDPGNEQALSEIVEDIKPDLIFHLAGSWVGTAAQLYAVNTVYAANLVEASRHLSRMPKILFAGTAAEYGPLPEGVVVAREDMECHPCTVYGISKLAQTHHALAAAQKGMPVVVGRLVNPLGPGMSETLALGSFAAQIRRMGKEGGVLKTGDLNAVRDFIDVADAARVFVDLAFCPAAEGQVVNVCTGQAVRLSEMVAHLIALSGKSVRHEIESMRGKPDSASHFVGSAEKLARLGIQVPAFDLDATLKRCLDYSVP